MSIEHQSGSEKTPRSVELMQNYVQRIDTQTHFVDIYTDTLQFMQDQFGYDPKSAQEIIATHQDVNLYPTVEEFESEPLLAKDKLLVQIADFMISTYDMRCQMEFIFTGKTINDDEYYAWMRSAYLAVADLKDDRHSLKNCRPHADDESKRCDEGVCPLRTAAQSVFKDMNGFCITENDFVSIAELGVDASIYLESKTKRLDVRYGLMQKCNIIPPLYVDGRYDDYYYNQSNARNNLHSFLLGGKKSSYPSQSQGYDSPDDDDTK